MNLRNIWLKTYTERSYRILLHIIFWILLLLATSGIKMYSVQYRLLGISISAIAYYSLAYVMLPLYFKRKLVIAIPFSIVYFIAILIIISIFYQILVSGYYSFMASQGSPVNIEIDPKQHINFGYSVLYFFFGIYLVILCPPLIGKFLREIYKEPTKALTLEKENVQMELNFLKSQVNPHFLFNTLNNIQSFIVNNEPERSVDLIGKLSELMRFSLYETGKDHLILTFIVTSLLYLEGRIPSSLCLTTTTSAGQLFKISGGII
jgi:two-component system LytT family sensor kinase